MQSRGHAVVLGGSITGLLAARVLADHFDKVTIVESSTLASDAQPRDKCPQGRHIHALLIRGEQELTHLFPDLVDSLLAQGAERVYSDEVAMFHFGEWKARSRFDGEFSALLFSRPLLEWLIADRVRRISNVDIVEHTKVLGLFHDSKPHAITGLQLSQGSSLISCDLVVDASGRGSKTPTWLNDLGYEPPTEYQLKVDVAYSTTLFKRPANQSKQKSDWRVLQVLPKPPHQKSLGTIFPIEGDRWMVTLASWFAEKPPVNHEEFLQQAKSLPVPDIYDAIKNLQAITPVVQHRVKSSRRRYYERCATLPAGLLVMGDALAAFNPVYGQGMTVAILQAMALQQALRKSTSVKASALKAAQHAIAKCVDLPWNMSTTEDRRFPETGESLSFFTRLLHKYTSGIHKACTHDLYVLKVAGGVNHMITKPTALLRPSVILRVIQESFKSSEKN